MKSSSKAPAVPTVKRKDSSCRVSHDGAENTKNYIQIERDLDKEDKEIKKAMEKVAKATFASERDKVKKEVMQEIQSEVSRLESFFAARMLQLEERIQHTNSKNEENFRLLDQRLLDLHGELNKMSESNIARIEKERQKRLEMVKKLHKIHKDELSSQKGEFATIKEKGDKFDLTGNIVEQLNKRVNRLEVTVRENLEEEKSNLAGVGDDGEDVESVDESHNSSDNENNYNRQNRKTFKKPSSNNNNNSNNKTTKKIANLQSKKVAKPKVSRIASIESALNNLQISQGGLEEDIEQLRIKFSSSSKASLVTSLGDELSEQKEECKQLKKNLEKRLRELGESTAKACKSLGTGISDLQQTSLNFFVWADKTHAAVGSVAEKVGFHSNPCPPVPLPNSATPDQKQ